jgi:hypothetical protein
MRLDVIKHRRVSIKVPSDNEVGHGEEAVDDNEVGHGEEVATPAAVAETTNGLRERRKVHQNLRITLNDDFFEPQIDWPAANAPPTADWRRRALEGHHRAAEEVNRCIASGDLKLLESLVLNGRADLLLDADHRENFVFGHHKSKQFFADLPEYKASFTE